MIFFLFMHNRPSNEIHSWHFIGTNITEIYVCILDVKTLLLLLLCAFQRASFDGAMFVSARSLARLLWLSVCVWMWMYVSEYIVMRYNSLPLVVTTAKWLVRFAICLRTSRLFVCMFGGRNGKHSSSVENTGNRIGARSDGLKTVFYTQIMIHDRRSHSRANFFFPSLFILLNSSNFECLLLFFIRYRFLHHQ